jgi:hypothetical protein
MLRILSLLITLFYPLISASKGAFQSPLETKTPLDNPEVRVTSPRSGQALQGVISIQGNCAIRNFSSARLEFSYTDNPTDTWFLIQTLVEPVSNNLLTQWDTSTITDGSYQVRLLVLATDEKEYQSVVENLRVRNYTPVETDTPAPTSLANGIITTGTPNPTPIPPSPTPLPANPLEISPDNIQSSTIKGIFTVFVVFTLFGLFQGLKRLMR